MTTDHMDDGFTPIPHWITTSMRNWPPAVTLVVLVIARHTYGWQRESDVISLSQLQQETGMSRPSVIAAIAQGVKLNVIIRTPEGQSHRYQLVKNLDQSLVKNLYQSDDDQSRIFTSTSKESLPELVKNLYPQYKEKESKEREEGAPPAHAPKRPAKRSPRPAAAEQQTLSTDTDTPVAIYRRVTKANPNPAQRAAITERVTDDLDLWQETCQQFAVNGWNVRNLGNLFDAWDKRVAGRSARTVGLPDSIREIDPAQREANRAILRAAIANGAIGGGK